MTSPLPKEAERVTTTAAAIAIAMDGPFELSTNPPSPPTDPGTDAGDADACAGSGPQPVELYRHRKKRIRTGWNCCDCYTNNDNRFHPAVCHRLHCAHERCSACIPYRHVFNGD